MAKASTRSPRAPIAATASIHGIAGLAQGKLHTAHQQQGDQQRVVELQQKLQPTRLAAAAGDAASAVLLEPPMSLRLAQARLAIAAKSLHNPGDELGVRRVRASR